ncbi:hypothetical protein CVT24_009323 [Panaeolus cyanescens]|uniref:LsmAD domain-containing protein n=1 Tax=Panaeolus cyanescens TaxID=181874 RepID=A0A409Y8B5_9AGAR|nr:hypothetical protein CVT24_009323 [Panaeolus cyanescens]
MSNNSRQSKSNRKQPQDQNSSRRPNAWGSGARASPTFSSANAPPPRQQQQQQQQHHPQPSNQPHNFQSLTQTNGSRTDNSRDRVLQSLSGLTGTTVTLTNKSGQRYEGVVGSTSGEGDTPGVTLKDVKEVGVPGAPLKDSLFIASANIDTFTSGPADARPTNGDSFRTDTDISQKKGLGGKERELQAWAPSGDPGSALGGLGDDDTFALGSNSGASWDQFTANEQLFGVKASFDEDVYTTKLDRNAPDFKERERKAQKIANEIINAATNNPHIAEERGHVIDDSGVNEEDRYGAVVRGQNAYIPPGARKAANIPPPAASQPAQAPESNAPKAEIPKVSVNGPDGTSVAAHAQSPPSSKAASPAPTASSATAPKPPADPLPAFRDFVANEKQRLTQKRQTLVKNDMDKRMAELVKFSQSFKLNKPIPEDLVPILAKDEEKQKLIKEKAKQDAASGDARAIGPSTPATASRGVAVVGNKALPKPAASPADGKPAAPPATAALKKASATGTTSDPPNKPTTTPIPPTTGTTSAATSTSTKKISMVIQSIPPFKGGKAKPAAASTSNTPTAAPGTSNGPSAPTINTNTAGSNGGVNRGGSTLATPISPNTAANRLNVNASSFRPNPKANAFNPVAPTPTKGGPPNAAAASNSVSPKPKQDSPATPNPFFGTRPMKKSAPVHVKDDFNPFKHNKVVDASQVSAMWPYSGKRYMQMFPAPQHPPAQHPPHMGPPMPPPMPPPSYEEDSAAQAATRGAYVYAYPPYGYPAQPMMPGMAPPGPPGAYMPGPYMQHMPYPPGMPPPNVAMYSPAMGQMPPPQAYMPPPPGAYPPPPNGVGPRPSMPPTPIPAHAHPYYHQSPQLQHAYPMMVPPHPPPNMPPHGYDGGPAPPVQMSGHA